MNLIDLLQPIVGSSTFAFLSGSVFGGYIVNLFLDKIHKNHYENLKSQYKDNYENLKSQYKDNYDFLLSQHKSSLQSLEQNYKRDIDWLKTLLNSKN